MAHEITKLKREDQNIMINDPRVTLTKELLERIVRETKVYVTGKVSNAANLISSFSKLNCHMHV